MKWTTVAAGLIAAGLLGEAAAAQTLRAPSAFGEVAPVQTVQYYQYDGYGDGYYDYYEPRTYRRTYRAYRERPSYGYGTYDTPRYYAPRYGYRDYIEDRKNVIREQRDAQKEAIKEQRRVQKDIFKERQRAWNRAHGY